MIMYCLNWQETRFLFFAWSSPDEPALILPHHHNETVKVYVTLMTCPLRIHRYTQAFWKLTSSYYDLSIISHISLLSRGSVFIKGLTVRCQNCLFWILIAAPILRRKVCLHAVFSASGEENSYQPKELIKASKNHGVLVTLLKLTKEIICRLEF